MAEKSIITKSWETEEQLFELAKARRERTIVRGVVTSVGSKEIRTHDNDGKSISAQVEVAILTMEDGSIGYCPAGEFSEREYRSLNGFTGSIQEFVISNIDLETRIVSVSIKQADQIKRRRLFELLKEEEEAGTLSGRVFEGTVNGFNEETDRIYVRIQGADAFMNRNDLDWGRVRGLLSDKIERGEKLQVKVTRFDEELGEHGVIQVSRKAAIPDPFKKLQTLKEMDSIAGQVVEVNPIHGIFVKLDIGLEVKGIKPASLPEPSIGDIVSCRIRSIDPQKRHAKVVLINYPRGKKKKKDIGAFLFE